MATPENAEQVAGLVRWAAREGLAIVPRGAGTGMPGGNVGPGLVLDLSRLGDIDPVDPVDGTVEAGAGAVADAVDRVARSAGRRLPALPSSSRWCTVGGMVACDAAGARSLAYGPVHAWLDAVQVVHADGTLAWVGGGRAQPPVWSELHRMLSATEDPRAAWPRVRKNSSGYALDRFLPDGDPAQLLCGSEGTLGVVTRVRLATRPVPEDRGALLLGVPDPRTLAAIAELARRLGASACEYFGRRLVELGALLDDPRTGGLDAGWGIALLEFEGARDLVDDGLAEAAAEARSWGGAREARGEAEVAALWELRHAASPTIARAAAEGRRSLQFIEDSVVPPDGLAAYLEGVEALLREADTDGVVFGHAGDAHLHVNPLIDLTRADWPRRVRVLLDGVVELVAGLGGTLAGEHGDGRLRAPLLERIWPASHVARFRTVKRSLDPEGVFNPGVVLPLPGQDPLEGFALGPDRQLQAAGGVA